MKSCIYSGLVKHSRFIPNQHTFSYRLFMMYLDLDELPTLFQRFWLWSHKRSNIAWFDRTQHTGHKTCDLDISIRQLVDQETGIYPTGPIRLLTHLKYFGYGFNPVSFYYCFDDDGIRLNTIVAEINNTPWNEQFCYVLPIRDTSQHFAFDKKFHVSPFNSMKQQYDWRLSSPEEYLTVDMNVYQDNLLHFYAGINLQRQEINSASLARVLIQFPLMTVKIIVSIYYQALKLWLKRTPFHKHPGKQEAP